MKKISGNNKGFTLVELIVVLVILAILAAVLVPALLGYIDRAKKAQDVVNAKNMLQATQAELSALYAKGAPMAVNGTKKGVIPGSSVRNNNNADTDSSKTDFAKTVIATADDEPYLFMVGLGHTGTYTSPDDIHKLYTVYYAAYLKDADSTPLFFDGKSWTEQYPTKNSVNATTTGITFQYYIISNKWGFNPESRDDWNTLKRKAGEIIP